MWQSPSREHLGCGELQSKGLLGTPLPVLHERAVRAGASLPAGARCPEHPDPQTLHRSWQGQSVPQQDALARPRQARASCLMSENLKKNRCFEFASVKRNVGNMTNIWELKMEPGCSSSARSKPILCPGRLAAHLPPVHR